VSREEQSLSNQHYQWQH